MAQKVFEDICCTIQNIVLNKSRVLRGANMTIKDLYEWAVKNGVEDFDIEIQYRDGGGYYYGSSSLYESDIEIDRLRSEVTL